MNGFAQEVQALAFHIVPASEPTETPTDFAGRLRVAMVAAGRTPTRTERESGLQQGYISKLLGTSKAKQILSPGPDVIRKLADYLRISYEWLAIGRGSMRTTEFELSPLESATRFALAHGARQDAIDAAIARYRDAPDMTGNDWVLAFNAEATRLDRAGVPRPEVVRSAQRKVSRLSRKISQQTTEIVELEERARARRARAKRPPAPVVLDHERAKRVREPNID